MEKRAILAIVLSLLIIVVWTYVFAPPPPPDTPVPKREAQEVPRTEPSPPSPTQEAASALPASEATQVLVDTGVARLVLTSQGAGVKEVELLDYRATLAKDAPPVTIAPVPEAAMPPLETRLQLQGRTVSLGQVVFTPSVSEVRLSPNQPQASVTFHGKTEDGIAVQRTYHFQHGSYVFAVSTEVEGTSSATASAMTLVWGPGFYENGSEGEQRQGQTAPLPRGYIGGRIFHKAPKEVGEVSEERGNVSWAALGDTYFAAVLIPQEPPAEAMMVRRVRQDALEIGIRTPLDREHRRQTVRVYVGPKAQTVLKQIEPSLGKYLIDLGFFSVLARPMLQFLILINQWVHNYGVTIILVTLLIKIVLWPLTQSSYKSMQAMQRLQPKMKELQAIYKDDRQALNRAMMQLYRDEKVNPMGGCLPMILQIPVFFAFYNALLYSIELRHAPFVCWEESLVWLGRGICDLSVYDPTYITPILMGVSMFFQQKLSPTSADPMQAKMMQFMPLFFLMFFLWAPAGLVIYWLVNNVLSIAQQLAINRMGRPLVAKAEVASKE